MFILSLPSNCNHKVGTYKELFFFLIILYNRKTSNIILMHEKKVIRNYTFTEVQELPKKQTGDIDTCRVKDNRMSRSICENESLTRSLFISQCHLEA